MYTLLVFAHLLAASTALGAIVATDLRLLSKLSADKVRIAPPNAFVARIVMLALLLLWTTGGAIVWLGLQERPDYLANPKLLAKIGLVVLLTVNAFVLHHVTFPRLARGRRVPRWTATDWIAIAVPVAASNALWLFVAFLGVARAWNYTVPAREVLEVFAALYIAVQLGVFAILGTAGRRVEPDRVGWADRLARSLAAVGNLGTRAEALDTQAPVERSRRSSGSGARAASSSRRRRGDDSTASSAAGTPASLPPALAPRAAARAAAAAGPVAPAAPTRPTLRLVDTQGRVGERAEAERASR